MTINSRREIIFLKKNLLNETQIIFIRNKINLIFKKSKKKSMYVFQKKINYTLKFCVENFFFHIFLEIIIKVSFFTKINVRSFNFLNQITGFIVKNSFYVYFKENIKILSRITSNKLSSKIVPVTSICFKKILEDSKGKIFIESGLKIAEFGKKMFFFYEFFQNCLETMRINLDNKYFTSYTIILNKVFQLFRTGGYFFQVSTCFYEQITRIFLLSGNFNLGILYYFKKLKNTLKNKKEFIKKKNFFTPIFCLGFLQNKNFYSSLILLITNHSSIIKSDKKFNDILNQIEFEHVQLSPYSQNLMHMRQNLTFYRAKIISRQCKSLYMSSVFKMSKKYSRNIEYWAHYFSSFKKIKKKFDGLRKVFCFSNCIY